MNLTDCVSLLNESSRQPLHLKKLYKMYSDVEFSLKNLTIYSPVMKMNLTRQSEVISTKEQYDKWLKLMDTVQAYFKKRGLHFSHWVNDYTLSQDGMVTATYDFMLESDSIQTLKMFSQTFTLRTGRWELTAMMTGLS